MCSNPRKSWFSQTKLEAALAKMLCHLYVRNGDVIWRQARGIPMGLECAPQPANLYGDSVEAGWVAKHNPTTSLARRFINRTFVVGPNALHPSKGLLS